MNLSLNDILYDNCSDLNFAPFSYSDKQYYDNEKSDADNNMHNKLLVNSLYYTEEQCNNKFSRDKISNQQFSIIHFYCRSLSSNYNNLKDSITALELKFDVIALSESWLSENDSDLYHIDDYNMFSNHSEQKRWRGCIVHK